MSLFEVENTFVRNRITTKSISYSSQFLLVDRLPGRISKWADIYYKLSAKLCPRKHSFPIYRIWNLLSGEINIVRYVNLLSSAQTPFASTCRGFVVQQTDPPQQVVLRSTTCCGGSVCCTAQSIEPKQINSVSTCQDAVQLVVRKEVKRKFIEHTTSCVTNPQ